MTDTPRPESETSTPAAPTAVADPAASEPHHDHAHGEHEHHDHGEHAHHDHGGHEHEHADDHQDDSDGGVPAKKLSQQVEMRDIGPCKKHIKVTVSAEDIQDSLNEQFSKLVVDSSLSGFRPGKAPRKIVERRYRKEVAEQVKSEMIYRSLEQLAEEHDLAPLSPPELDPTSISLPESGPMMYEFDVEVRPEFDLPNYKGLKIRRPVHTYSEEELVNEEQRQLASYGQLVPKPEGNAQVGDYLVADMTFTDGAITLGTSKEVTIRVEPRLLFKDGVINGFAEKIKGVNGGEKRELEVQLFTNVAAPSLRGKTATATFEVKDVKSMRLPELTHEFLHTFGVHSPEQFRERTVVLLQRRLEHQQRRSAREQVLGQIAATATWDLPADLLARQARRALSRRVMEMRADGMSEEEINSRARLLSQDIMQSTAMAMKEHFVLQKVAEAEKIDVTEDDIQDEIDRLADMNNESPRRVRARLEKDDLMEALAAEMIERKALDLILASAEYEDVPLEQFGVEQRVTAVEEQAVAGEMQDPTTAEGAAAAAAASAGAAAAAEPATGSTASSEGSDAAPAPAPPEAQGS